MLWSNFNILGCNQEVNVVRIHRLFKQLSAVAMQCQLEFFHALLTHLVIFDQLDRVVYCPLLAFLFTVTFWTSQPVHSIVLFLTSLLHALIVVVLQLVLLLHWYIQQLFQCFYLCQCWAPFSLSQHKFLLLLDFFLFYMNPLELR
jgi:hypothetical protein